MLLNRIPELNLRYAFGEVALIFIGVTAAFVFDQFKEERSMMAEERAVLSEIVEDLNATKIDLISDIENSEQRVGALVDVMSAVQSKDPAGLATINIRAVVSGSKLYPKISGYRALQNAGLGLVSDRKVRASLTNFFELRLSRVQDREDIVDQTMRPLIDLLMDHIIVQWNITVPDSVPTNLRDVRADSIALRDAQALLAEPELTIILHSCYSAGRASIHTYEETLLDVENLIEAIETHLEAIN